MKKESTPFAVLNVTTDDNRHIWAKFYWSKNSGIYGHQVITECNPTGDLFITEKTNGCGFCKKSAALESFIMLATGKYISIGGDLDYYLNNTKYHTGGNEYSLPIEKLTNIANLKQR